jgi:glycosyltransferase involved in cell wall biosynthesis
MKIAFDHQTFTMQSYGGISRYYTILADELLKRGQDSKVFAGFHRNNYVSDLPDGVVKGIKLINYPPKSHRLFKLLSHGVSQFQIKSWQPDIVHETYYSALPTLKANTLRVTTVYDMIHELFNGQFPSQDKTTQWKKKTFDRVDHIISISHSTKKDLIELFGIDETKISVVHLGVDLNAFQQPKIENHFKDQSFILYVGSRGGYKNFDGFLKACARSNVIKNKIKIVAFGGGLFSSEEISRINALGFQHGFVQHVGGSDELLASLYASALCFVYPSLYEGFGLPPLEAMAAKCPVLSSNTSSMPEVINQAGVYFDPYNIDEMCSIIETVVLDENLRYELVQLGLKNIKLFSWHKCANETLEIYKKLTGKE